MESNWAVNQLQVIRTLMERSAIYRRALAPIMIYNGLLGLAAGGLGWKLQFATPTGFVRFWAAVALLGLAGSFLLVRRQALKEAEPFWSPPTRRVALALTPGLLIGLILGLLASGAQQGNWLTSWRLVGLWLCLYGSALHAAGFFMARGMRWLGWIFAVSGMVCLGMLCLQGEPPQAGVADLAMGAVFGGLHLAYGIYLYFTEPRGNEP
jgi:hypothetical protein